MSVPPIPLTYENILEFFRKDQEQFRTEPESGIIREAVKILQQLEGLRHPRMVTLHPAMGS